MPQNSALLGWDCGQLVKYYDLHDQHFILNISTGCAPAMINYNLGGDALIHCLKISSANLILTDDDKTCKARILEEEHRIEAELGMTIVELSEDVKSAIAARDGLRLSDDYRKEVKGNSPAALFYTR